MGVWKTISTQISTGDLNWSNGTKTKPIVNWDGYGELIKQESFVYIRHPLSSKNTNRNILYDFLGFWIFSFSLGVWDEDLMEVEEMHETIEQRMIA